MNAYFSLLLVMSMDLDLDYLAYVEFDLTTWLFLFMTMTMMNTVMNTVSMSCIIEMTKQEDSDEKRTGSRSDVIYTRLNSQTLRRLVHSRVE